MKIAIASDHAGFPLKEEVREYVARLGHDVRRLNKVRAIEKTYMPSAVGTALNL